MTREKAEELIENSLREAWRIYKTYNPDGQYLTMTVSRGSVMINNQHWNADRRRPIDVVKPLRKEGSQ